MYMYLILMIVITLILGSIVPLIQFVIYNQKLNRQPSLFLFSQTLLDFDLDTLTFENVDSKSANVVVNRLGLADRGWIRCPNGTIMSNEDFSEKKKCEYDIELP